MNFRITLHVKYRFRILKLKPLMVNFARDHDTFKVDLADDLLKITCVKSYPGLSLLSACSAHAALPMLARGSPDLPPFYILKKKPSVRREGR